MTVLATALDEKVLVLNRLYRAVRVISARRAFVMLCKQAAEVIAVENGYYRTYDFASWLDIAELQHEFEYDEHTFIRTPSIVIAVPKVIRLLAYDKLPRREVKLNRRNIYARDSSRCQYCGGHFATKDLTLDHIVPRVQGGENSWHNLVCACYRCNARKGGRTPDQARMKLIRVPTKPKFNPAITIRLGSKKYQTWKAFLDEAYWTVELKE